jgi:hypothetical protein
MLPRIRIRQALAIVAWGGLVLLARPGHAAPSCPASYKQGLKQEQAGKLREAQKAFSACSRASCGAAVRRDCILRFGQLGSDIPSVVPVVTDPTGEPVLDVKVTMDGETLTTKIDGRAVPVDPGLHEFSFSSPVGASSQKIVILQGQRNRPIAVTLGGAPRAAPVAKGKPAAPAIAEPPPLATPAQATALVEPETSPASSAMAPPAVTAEAASTSERADEPGSPTFTRQKMTSLAPYLLAGVGLAGVGGFAALTYWGRKDNDMLSQCSPNCTPQSVDHVRQLYLGANISLGVGLVALAGATYL